MDQPQLETLAKLLASMTCSIWFGLLVLLYAGKLYERRKVRRQALDKELTEEQITEVQQLLEAYADMGEPCDTVHKILELSDGTMVPSKTCVIVKDGEKHLVYLPEGQNADELLDSGYLIDSRETDWAKAMVAAEPVLVRLADASKKYLEN